MFFVILCKLIPGISSASWKDWWYVIFIYLCYIYFIYTYVINVIFSFSVIGPLLFKFIDEIERFIQVFRNFVATCISCSFCKPCDQPGLKLSKMCQWWTFISGAGKRLIKERPSFPVGVKCFMVEMYCTCQRETSNQC